MGNRAKRRAKQELANLDPHLTQLDRRILAINVEMDRRGFVLCELDGEFYFEPKEVYAAAKRAA
jgi:hypothetical protein